MKKSLEQYLFDEMYKQSLLLNYRTFDYKPTDDTSYPFVEIGNTEVYRDTTKTSLQGRLNIQLNVYGLARERKRVSEMTHNLWGKAYYLKKIGNRSVALNEQASTIRIIDDESTNTKLKRGIVELEFRIL